MFTYRKSYWLLRYSLSVGCLTLSISCKHSDPLAGLLSDQVNLVQALNQLAIPIKDADPSREFSDLTSLDSLLTKAQVVGLGEATHGTHEFSQIKHRLFRYLVEHHGFRTLAFEANYGRCILINRYIHGQSTDLASATVAAQSMYFWPWATAEVRDLIEWMRQYNATKSGSDQISFYGVDCQYADDEFPLIKEYLTRVEPIAVAQVDSLTSLFAIKSQRSASDPVQQQYAQKLTNLNALFVINKSKWVLASDGQEYDLVRQAARVLVQQQDITAGTTNYCHRDQYLAENVTWLLTHVNQSKVGVWAHDQHVANWSSACGLPMMGARLKQQLKAGYLIIGTSLSDGSFNARNEGTGTRSVRAFSIQSGVLPDSYNYLLGKTEIANYILNLSQSLSSSVLNEWLTTGHPTFEPGGGYDESRPDFYCATVQLKDRYDILFHFRNTSPTQLLP